MGQHHILHSSPETIHWGVLDAAMAPRVRARSGDRVTIHCLSGDKRVMPGAPYEVLPEHRAVHEQCRPQMPGHILTGPVHIEGAMPGDLLEVRILGIELRQNWGWNVIRPLGGTLPEDFPNFRLLHLPLDRNRMVATMPWGMEVPLAPFFGVMAVAPPPTYGPVSTIQPREFGGNMDLKELVVGTTLFLPVWAEGALFSVGDGHACQGDGEVCLTALETALSGTFELVLHKNSPIRFPRAETPTHHITMGLNEDLDDAAKQALREMIRLLGEIAGLSPEDAYTLCSLAVDLRVTQTVDGNKGIHAMLAKSLLAKP